MSRTSNLTHKLPQEVAAVLSRENTINEAAIALNVAPGTLYRYIRSKGLKRETTIIWIVQSEEKENALD